MPEIPAASEAVLEVVSPDGSQMLVAIDRSPFCMGRGGDAGNHLQLADRRISRQCAAILAEDGRHYLEDRGHRLGVFVNGELISRRELAPGDAITFGLEDSYTLVYRASAPESTIQSILTRIEGVTGTRSAAAGLGNLNMLLEASMLLHSQLPLEAVLGTMLDHAIVVTNADRGSLLEQDSSGVFRPRLARQQGGTPLPPASMAPTQTVVRLALEKHSSVITGDTAQAGAEFQAAQSIMAQRLRTVVVIPLYGMAHGAARDLETTNIKCGDLLGLLYLDSRRPAAFSTLDRRILDALAADAASVLDKARLVENDLQREHMEQELNIARNIQQALLPRSFGHFERLAVTGTQNPCQEVGGDYFDVFPLDEGRTAFLISDVSGKGLGAALLSTMLQGALSAMSIGADPALVFQHINRYLCDHSRLDRHATMFFGIVDAGGGLEYLNAGHPSPLLLRHGQVTPLYTQGSLPVGLVPEATYTVTRTRLDAGDTLVLFSDGVTEATDPRGDMFGDERLSTVVGAQPAATIDDLQKRILDAVERFAHGAAQADDITVLLVRYLAEGAAAAS